MCDQVHLYKGSFISIQSFKEPALLQHLVNIEYSSLYYTSELVNYRSMNLTYTCKNICFLLVKLAAFFALDIRFAPLGRYGAP